MEINLQENKKNKIILELKGADHTFCNVLKKELWNDSSVKTSAYSVEHPLVGIPKLIVETTGKDALKAVEDAATRLEKQNSAFLTAFKKAK